MYLYYLEAVLNASVKQGRVDFSFILGVGTCQMSFVKIDDIREATVAQSILLLPITTIKKGTDKVICLFAFYDVVDYMSFIEPHKVT